MRPSRESILSEIDTLKRYKNLIVVEGEHDSDALKRLGLERIFILNKTGVSLYNQIDTLINMLKIRESCVILTDLDKKGKTYYKLIKKELESRGMKSNRRLREILTKTGVSHIEGLATFLKQRRNEDN